MDFLIGQDIESVLEITGSSTKELAEILGVSRISVSNWINGKSHMSEKYMRAFYQYVFKQKIRLNKIKEQFYREDLVKDNELLLFHGAKTKIEGGLSLTFSKGTNDFGDGFYCGESLEQSAMFVATHSNSSLYMLRFDPSDLVSREFKVNREWMLAIAYYRGKLDAYADSEPIKELIESTEDVDYIIAPIADNRMFEIIDQFIEGEITDIQCQHCLSATNLGKQYVFTSQKALNQITLLERCFLTESEKESYLDNRKESYLMNRDKVKLARKQYRNQGNYIEDILQ